MGTPFEKTRQCPIDDTAKMADLCAEAREKLHSERCFNSGCKRCFPHGLTCRCGKVD